MLAAELELGLIIEVDRVQGKLGKMYIARAFLDGVQQDEASAA
jgi:hypothetical protein